MSLSFITAFREFKGDQNRIQSSCMYSWRANGIKVFVPINEADIEEKCKDWENVSLIGQVQSGRDLGFNNGCPVIKDMILKALPLIETKMVALINSDIIIDKDFVERTQKIFDKYGHDIFMAGSRKDLTLNVFIETPETYQQVLNQERVIHNPSTSSDIFIASKEIWGCVVRDMPPFLLGRFCWDNWLHAYAENNELNKLNCTDALLLLHCEHGYVHVEKQENASEGEAASTQYNVKLYEGVLGKKSVRDITKWPKVVL